MTVPPEVDSAVRELAADATEEEVGQILAAYPALRAAADRLYEVPEVEWPPPR